MYTGIIAAVVIITTFVALKATIGSNSEIFSSKGTACVVLGAILGIPVCAALINVSHFMGYVGMGASIGLMYVLFYSGVVNAIIQRIPANFRRIVRNIFNVFRIVLTVAIIFCAVVGLLAYIRV